MASAIARRIARLEFGRIVAVPNVVEVGSDETDDEAFARFIVKHRRAPSSCIVVPERCREDELEQQERIWADLQRALVAAAKSSRHQLKEEPNGRNRQRIISRNPGSRVLPPKHAIADAAKRDDRQP